MGTYFDVIPEELVRLIIIKTFDEEAPWTIKDAGVPAFTKVIYSIVFWKEAFEYKGYMPLNKDLMYLLEGVPFIVNKYKNYTPEEMFDIFNFEYVNIETSYIILKDMMKFSYLEVRISNDVFTDIQMLKDNLDVSQYESYLYDAMAVIPYLEMYTGAAQYVKGNTSMLYLIHDKDLYQATEGDTGSVLVLKHGRKSFENILLYVIYHRHNFTYFTTT